MDVSSGRIGLGGRRNRFGYNFYKVEMFVGVKGVEWCGMEWGYYNGLYSALIIGSCVRVNKLKLWNGRCLKWHGG